MIWADKTHQFTATLCRHTGRPCPAAARMVRKLAAAMTEAEAVTEADFEITGTAALSGCARQCTAKYAASHHSIRLFAGVEETADADMLHRLADALLDPDGQPLHGVAKAAVPCAMLDVKPRPGKTADLHSVAHPAA